MDFDTAGVREIAEAIAAELGRDSDYLPIDDGGATLAAQLIADLL